MSFERLPVPIDRRLPEMFRHGAIWGALVAFIQSLRQQFADWLAADAETDSIAWEDGEVDEDGVPR